MNDEIVYTDMDEPSGFVVREGSRESESDERYLIVEIHINGTIQEVEIDFNRYLPGGFGIFLNSHLLTEKK